MSTPDSLADHAPDPACTAEAMREPATTEPKPAQADAPCRPAPTNTEPGQAMAAPIKPEQAKPKVDQAVPEQVKPNRVKPNRVKPDRVKPNLIEIKADRVKAPRAAPKMLLARPRGSASVPVPPVNPSVHVPTLPALPAVPLVAATPELVLSHRAPVLVTDARPGGPELGAKSAELASALRFSNGPSGSAAGSTTGLAAVGGLLVLGLVSTRLTAKGRKRRPAPGAAR